MSFFLFLVRASISAGLWFGCYILSENDMGAASFIVGLLALAMSVFTIIKLLTSE